MTSIAQVLGVSLTWLETGSEPGQVGGLDMVGYIAYGVWRDETAQKVFEKIPLAPAASHRPSQRAYQVIDDSANIIAPSGYYLHTVEVVDYSSQIDRGDHVVVQRRDGSKIEHTARRVERRLTNDLLVGQSTRMEIPEINLAEIEDGSVKVVDLIIATWNPIKLGGA